MEKTAWREVAIGKKDRLGHDRATTELWQFVLDLRLSNA